MLVRAFILLMSSPSLRAPHILTSDTVPLYTARRAVNSTSSTKCITRVRRTPGITANPKPNDTFRLKKHNWIHLLRFKVEIHFFFFFNYFSIQCLEVEWPKRVFADRWTRHLTLFLWIIIFVITDIYRKELLKLYKLLQTSKPASDASNDFW